MAKTTEICPEYVGEKRIKLSVLPDIVIRPSSLVDVFVDASAALEGLVLPLDLMVAPPTRDNRTMRTFTLWVPSSFVVRVEEPGIHVITLRERHHNRWYGYLSINVLEV